MENFGKLAWEYGLRPVGNLLQVHGERGKQNYDALVRALRSVLKADGYAHRHELLRSLNNTLFSKVDHKYLRTEQSFNSMIAVTLRGMSDIHVTTLEQAIRATYRIDDSCAVVMRGESPTSTIYYRALNSLRSHVRNDFERAYEFRKKQINKA